MQGLSQSRFSTLQLMGVQGEAESRFLKSTGMSVTRTQWRGSLKVDQAQVLPIVGPQTSFVDMFGRMDLRFVILGRALFLYSEYSHLIIWASWILHSSLSIWQLRQ